MTPDILPRFGIAGLYTSTLFRFQPELFSRLGPAIELGRSFVRPEYQKQYAPLLLLWKGISRCVARRPGCAVLFGCVSISSDYGSVSRELLSRFLRTRTATEVATLVKSRSPYQPCKTGRWESALLESFLQDVDGLADPIADLEQGEKNVPVLVRHYVKLGGRVLGLSVDRKFSNVLDALIMVDLRNVPRAVLDRYMSPELAADFLKYHGRSGQPAALHSVPAHSMDGA
jgi:putative hemolysin